MTTPTSRQPSDPSPEPSDALDARPRLWRARRLLRGAIHDVRRTRRALRGGDEPQLTRAFADAIRQAGFLDGEVSEVDCSECPCIVFGRGLGDEGDAEKLAMQPAFAPFAEAHRHAFGWSTRSGERKTWMFGIALTRPDTPLTDDARQRLSHRARAWWDASKPAPPAADPAK